MSCSSQNEPLWDGDLTPPLSSSPSCPGATGRKKDSKGRGSEGTAYITVYWAPTVRLHGSLPVGFSGAQDKGEHYVIPSYTVRPARAT